MARQPARVKMDLGFLDPRRLGQSHLAVHLVGDGIYASPEPGHNAEATRVGSLSAHVKAWASQVASQLPRERLLIEAQDYVQSLPELRFCLEELIPTLRWLKEAGPACPARGADLQRMLDDLSKQAAELQKLVARRVRLAPGSVARWFGTPCAIIGQAVVPLEPAASVSQPQLHVTIGGEAYRYRLERARSLDDLLSAVEREIRSYVSSAIPNDVRRTGLAGGFLTQVRSVLARCSLIRRGAYKLLYQDGTYSLQHRGGEWILVRGPVAMRNGRDAVWVGLHIKGRTRRQRLAVVPYAATDPDAFWTPSGAPVRGGLCVGGRRQYAHLFSSTYGEAEALLAWIDAGVILITGRSNFHRLWRERRAKEARRAVRAGKKG